MKRMDFKMVKDGSRTIIVLDGADSETDAALYRILCAACGIEAPIGAAEQAVTAESLPTTRVEGLSPAPEADKIPSADAINQMDSYADILRRGTTISSGAYKGMTAQQVLNKDKEAGMATLFTYARQLPSGAERDAISKACKQFMFDLPNMRHLYPTRDDKLSFLTHVSKMMNIDALVNGYKDLRDFESYASDDEVNNVFVIATKALQERSTQNSAVQ